MTVKRRATTGQIILAFNETEQLNDFEHDGWWVHIHSERIPFDETSIFSGLTTWLRVAVNTWYNVRLSHTRLSLLEDTGTCSAEDNAEWLYTVCMGECMGKKTNMTMTCMVPWFEAYPYPPGFVPCRTFEEFAANSPSHHRFDEESFVEMSSGCRCLKPCTSEQYEVNQQIVWQLRDTTVYQDLPWLIGLNASRVDLSLPAEVQVIQEKEAYSFQTFISEVGGSLGLMLGGSLLTFVEIFDCIITACCARRWKRW